MKLTTEPEVERQVVRQVDDVLDRQVEVEVDGATPSATPPRRAAPLPSAAGGPAGDVTSHGAPEVDARHAKGKARRPRGKARGKARGRGRRSRASQALARRCRLRGSAAQLARALKIDRTTIGRWIAGERVPNVIDALALDQRAGIPVAWWIQKPEVKSRAAARLTSDGATAR